MGEAVRFCTRVADGDVATRYQVLQTAILEWMRRADRQYATLSGKTMSFNRSMLNSYLKENDKVLAFGEVMNFLISGKFPTEEVWSETVEELRTLLELGRLEDKAAEFAAYDHKLSTLKLSNPA